MGKTTNSLGDLAKALVISPAGWLPGRASTSVRKALDDRMTFSEAMEAAGRIVDAFPNGGRDATKSYIGALAEILSSYPRQVALACSSIRGVVRQCHFLPTVADLVAWCEDETEPLRRQHDREVRVAELSNEREKEAIERPRRLTIEELKQKYGDWHTGESAESSRETARRKLIAQIGQDAFDALPDAREAGK